MADSIAQLLRWAKAVLLSESAALDAEILLAFVLDKPRSYLYAWPEKIVAESGIMAFRQLIAERQQGKPVAYLLGAQEFWSLSLRVTSATLIPRPETEQLVDAVLSYHQNNHILKVLDAGTGSGAIAIALAKENPEWQVYACDISMEALAIARENALKHNVVVSFFNSNWLSSVADESVDVVVSNPPYIEQGDGHLAALSHEPQSALVAGDGGFADISAVIRQAARVLKVTGSLYIEHGYDQAAKVRQIFQQHDFAKVLTCKDYAGCDRFTCGVKS